jgi:hypothetical protein
VPATTCRFHNLPLRGSLPHATIESLCSLGKFCGVFFEGPTPAQKKGRIKTGISFLASLSLVYVEQVPSKTNSFGVSSAYRLVGLDSYNHMGTKGRGNLQDDAAPADYAPHL